MIFLNWAFFNLSWKKFLHLQCWALIFRAKDDFEFLESHLVHFSCIRSLSSLTKFFSYKVLETVETDALWLCHQVTSKSLSHRAAYIYLHAPLQATLRCGHSCINRTRVFLWRKVIYFSERQFLLISMGSKMSDTVLLALSNASGHLLSHYHIGWLEKIVIFPVESIDLDKQYTDLLITGLLFFGFT